MTNKPFANLDKNTRQALGLEPIHWVRDKGQNRPTLPLRPEPCRHNHCSHAAVAGLALYIPASPLSVRKTRDVRCNLAGLYFCDEHFKAIQAEPKQFVEGERGRPIREAVELQFKKRGAGIYPNFDKVVIGRLPLLDPDFRQGQIAVDAVRKKNGD